MLRRVGLIAIVFHLILAAYLGQAAYAQRGTAAAADNPYLTAGAWTLGMMTGSLNGATIHMANDLARTLNEFPELRIVPMVGTGSIQNINDLLYLKGVDVAIVQQDVLSFLKRTKRMPGVEDRIQYIAKLHSEEFHVLARMKYLCLADLSGRKVNFGPEGSGSAITAQAIFEAHQVKVQPQYLDQDTAVEKLRTGEIDALVFVSGKPASAFSRIRYLDSVHFLDVEFVDTLQRDYLPAIMTHDDYPDLIAPNETVATVAVSAVMAVATSKPKTEQYNKISKFVENFFGKFEQLKVKPQHGKWHEVNLYAPVAGWTRFQPAQAWITENPQSETQTTGSLIASIETKLKAAVPDGKATPTTDEIRSMFAKFLQTRKADNGESREDLFNQFVRWYQENHSN